MKFAFASDNNEKKKNMKTSIYKELDATLLQWISQVRSKGTLETGPIVSSKSKKVF